MKNIFKGVAIAILALATNTGCEDDKGSNYETPNYLVGTWELKQSGTLSSTGIVQYDAVDACNQEFSNISFTPNYTYVNNNYAEADCSLTSTSGTYAILNGDIVLSNLDTTEDRLDVTRLTDKELDVVISDAGGALTFLKYFKVLPNM